MFQAQHTTPSPATNADRLWDRTVRRRLFDVARGKPFRFGLWAGVVVEHLAEGLSIRYEDGREAFLSPSLLVEIPYGVGALD